MKGKVLKGYKGHRGTQTRWVKQIGTGETDEETFHVKKTSILSIFALVRQAFDAQTVKSLKLKARIEKSEPQA